MFSFYPTCTFNYGSFCESNSPGHSQSNPEDVKIEALLFFSLKLINMDVTFDLY